MLRNGCLGFFLVAGPGLEPGPPDYEPGEVPFLHPALVLMTIRPEYYRNASQLYQIPVNLSKQPYHHMLKPTIKAKRKAYTNDTSFYLHNGYFRPQRNYC